MLLKTPPSSQGWKSTISEPCWKPQLFTSLSDTTNDFLTFRHFARSCKRCFRLLIKAIKPYSTTGKQSVVSNLHALHGHRKTAVTSKVCVLLPTGLLGRMPYLVSIMNFFRGWCALLRCPQAKQNARSFASNSKCSGWKINCLKNNLSGSQPTRARFYVFIVRYAFASTCLWH
jgi:hypothetical protein